jgi:hypothetical protein
LLQTGDTLDNLRAAASTAGAGADELALADDDALASPSPAPSIGRTVRNPGSSNVLRSKAGGSGSGTSGSSPSGSGPKRPAADKPDSALDSPLPALSSQDSLVQLLGEQLPEALVSARPPGNPLGLTGDLLLSPLGSAPAEKLSYTSGAEAYLRAAAEARKQAPRTWSERLEALVSDEGPGGISYSLWFLIGAGMLLGLIVCIVGFSYYQTTKALEVNEDRQTESRED